VRVLKIHKQISKPLGKLGIRFEGIVRFFGIGGMVISLIARRAVRRRRWRCPLRGLWGVFLLLLLFLLLASEGLVIFR